MTDMAGRILFHIIMAALTVGCILLLEKLIGPFFRKIGDRLGAVLFRKRREREREYLERLNIAECLQEDFCMPIDEVVTVAGVGTVVVGTVESGVCREGEQVYLEQEDGRREITLGQIDLETLLRKPDGKAYRTEHIAVSLTGVSQELVKAGSRVIAKNRE